MRPTALVTLLVLVAVTSAQAEEDAAVRVEGKKGNVVVNPDGSVRVVDGDKTVEVGADGSIRIDGGAGKQVESTAPAPTTGGDGKFLENNGKGAHDCAGKTASIAGNNNKYVFTNCANVVVYGNNNRVTLGAGAESVELLGNHNKAFADTLAKGALLGNHNALDYAKGANGKSPALSNPGKYNKITRK